MDFLNAESAVFRTVTTGNIELINHAINNYKDSKGGYHRYNLFQKTDSDGRNLLHYVCLYNTDEVATWMLSLKDDNSYRKAPIPKVSDHFGATPVMYAARAGMVMFVREWVQRNGDIKTVDKCGRNVLHYCCFGQSTTYKVPQVADSFKMIKETMKEISHILIENGVDCNCKDNTGKTPIQYFVHTKVDKCLDLINNIKLWKYMYTCALFGTKTPQAFGGLMHLTVAHCFVEDAVYFNKNRVEEVVETIKECKLDVNETDDNGMTALHHLCYYEYDNEPYGLREALVAELLELGADPDVKDIRGYTPLMCALDKRFVVADNTDPRNTSENSMGRLLNINSLSSAPKMTENAETYEEMKKVIKKSNDETLAKLEDIIELKSEVKAMAEKLEASYKLIQDFQEIQRDMLEKMNEQHQELMELRATPKPYPKIKP